MYDGEHYDVVPIQCPVIHCPILSDDQHNDNLAIRFEKNNQKYPKIAVFPIFGCHGNQLARN